MRKKYNATLFLTQLFNIAVKFVLSILDLTIEEQCIALLTSEEATVI